jgi:hypothetical protein
VQFSYFVQVGDSIGLAYRKDHPEDAFVARGVTEHQLLAVVLVPIALVAALFAIPPTVSLSHVRRASKTLKGPPTRALFDWYPNRNAGQSRKGATLGSLQAEDRLSWGPLTVALGASPPIDQTPTYLVFVYGDPLAGPSVIVNEHWTFVIRV